MCPCYSSRLGSSLKSLQRPLPVYELHMYSRNAVSAGGARANRGKSSHVVLIARESNETADCNIERGEETRALHANVLGDCLFTLDHRSIHIHQFDAYVHRHVVSRVRFAFVPRSRLPRLVKDSEFVKRTIRNLVTLPRLTFITLRRTFADERNTNFKHGCLWSGPAAEVPHYRPDSILIFNVIVNAQLPRHGNRHVQQPAPFGRPLQCESGAERRHVD